jgi:hypothetical protein
MIFVLFIFLLSSCSVIQTRHITNLTHNEIVSFVENKHTTKSKIIAKFYKPHKYNIDKYSGLEHVQYWLTVPKTLEFKDKCRTFKVIERVNNKNCMYENLEIIYSEKNTIHKYRLISIWNEL